MIDEKKAAKIGRKLVDSYKKGSVLILQYNCINTLQHFTVLTPHQTATFFAFKTTTKIKWYTGVIFSWSLPWKRSFPAQSLLHTLSLLSVKEEERAAKIAAEEDNDRVSALKKMEKEGLAQFSVLSIFSSSLDRSFVRRKWFSHILRLGKSPFLQEPFFLSFLPYPSYPRKKNFFPSLSLHYTTVTRILFAGTTEWVEP